MTPKPIVVNVETSTLDAYLIMSKFDLRHLPVEKNEKLVGIISERDILKSWSDSPGNYPVVEVAMSPVPYVVDPSEKMETILPVMIENGFGCVIVRKTGEEIAGIFTTTDALKVLTEFFRGHQAS